MGIFDWNPIANPAQQKRLNEQKRKDKHLKEKRRAAVAKLAKERAKSALDKKNRLNLKKITELREKDRLEQQDRTTTRSILFTKPEKKRRK